MSSQPFDCGREQRESLSAPIPSAVVHGLYPHLLGHAWDQLSEPVRRIHGGGRPVRARGTFDVTRGSGLLVRWLCAMLRLPRSGAAQPVLLVVTPSASGERWDRTIGSIALVTTQAEGAGRQLVERFGPVELNFRLDAVDGALVFSQTRAVLRLGPFRMPLPGQLAPRVSARASADKVSTGIRVWVRLSLPLGDPLVTYEGAIEEEPSKP